MFILRSAEDEFSSSSCSAMLSRLFNGLYPMDMNVMDASYYEASPVGHDAYLASRSTIHRI